MRICWGPLIFLNHNCRSRSNVTNGEGCLVLFIYLVSQICIPLQSQKSWGSQIRICNVTQHHCVELSESSLNFFSSWRQLIMVQVDLQWEASGREPVPSLVLVSLTSWKWGPISCFSQHDQNGWSNSSGEIRFCR